MDARTLIKILFTDARERRRQSKRAAISDETRATMLNIATAFDDLASRIGEAEGFKAATMMEIVAESRG